MGASGATCRIFPWSLAFGLCNKHPNQETIITTQKGATLEGPGSIRPLAQEVNAPVPHPKKGPPVPVGSRSFCGPFGKLLGLGSKNSHEVNFLEKAGDATQQPGLDAPTGKVP